MQRAVDQSAGRRRQFGDSECAICSLATRPNAETDSSNFGRSGVPKPSKPPTLAGRQSPQSDRRSTPFHRTHLSRCRYTLLSYLYTFFLFCYMDARVKQIRCNFSFFLNRKYYLLILNRFFAMFY